MIGVVTREGMPTDIALKIAHEVRRHAVAQECLGRYLWKIASGVSMSDPVYCVFHSMFHLVSVVSVCVSHVISRAAVKHALL